MIRSKIYICWCWQYVQEVFSAEKKPLNSFMVRCHFWGRIILILDRKCQPYSVGRNVDFISPSHFCRNQVGHTNIYPTYIYFPGTPWGTRRGSLYRMLLLAIEENVQDERKIPRPEKERQSSVGKSTSKALCCLWGYSWEIEPPGKCRLAPDIYYINPASTLYALLFPRYINKINKNSKFNNFTILTQFSQNWSIFLMLIFATFLFS